MSAAPCRSPSRIRASLRCHPAASGQSRGRRVARSPRGRPAERLLLPAVALAALAASASWGPWRRPADPHPPRDCVLLLPVFTLCWARNVTPEIPACYTWNPNMLLTPGPVREVYPARVFKAHPTGTPRRMYAQSESAGPKHSWRQAVATGTLGRPHRQNFSGSATAKKLLTVGPPPSVATACRHDIFGPADSL